MRSSSSRYCSSLPHNKHNTPSSHNTGSLPHQTKERSSRICLKKQSQLNENRESLSCNNHSKLQEISLNSSNGCKNLSSDAFSQLSSSTRIASRQSLLKKPSKAPTKLSSFLKQRTSSSILKAASTPDILLSGQHTNSSCRMSGRDEGYWTMSSNEVAPTRSSSTFPRACPKRVTSTLNVKLLNSFNNKFSADSYQKTSKGVPPSSLLFTSGSFNCDSRCVSSYHSTKLFNSCTVPRFCQSLQEKNIMQPSKTHHSISLSGSKYLSPMACDGLIRIISDMIKEIYVNILPEGCSTKENGGKGSIPIKLSFVNSPEEALQGRARGIYHLFFEPCVSSQCSVCADMVTRGTSIFEVFWPCPEGRKLQLIQMTKKLSAECDIVPELDCSADNSTSSQATNTSTVTQIPKQSKVVKTCSAHSMPRSTSNNGSCRSTWCDKTDSETTSGSVQCGLDPEFDQPELEWYGGSFQHPDNDWPQVNEFIVPSRESPRSGCSDQLAVFPNDSMCGSYQSGCSDQMGAAAAASSFQNDDCSESLRGNLSFNSSRMSDLDNLTDRMSDKLFYMSSCPDLTSDGCSDMLMPEGISDMTSLESCSEGDLMSIDRYMTNSSREYYSIVNIDVDMFSPTQHNQSGPLLPLHSLCHPPLSSPHNSSCSNSPPPNSCLPSHTQQSNPAEEFPDPPFPDPPEELFPSPPPPDLAPPPPPERTVPTPAPSVPPHLGPVDSPSVPKRVTSRPLPQLPADECVEDLSEFPQLADYTIAEHVESPSPPPIVPVRRRIPASCTNTNIKQNSSRTKPFSTLSTSHSLSSTPNGSPYPPYRLFHSRTPNDGATIPLSEVSPLPHIMRGPAPPPRAPKRSSSLLSHSRPVSTVDYQMVEQQLMQRSEGEARYGSLSNGSSPLEGLESSWVRLNAENVNHVSIRYHDE